jgi:hypothetical protein
MASPVQDDVLANNQSFKLPGTMLVIALEGHVQNLEELPVQVGNTYHVTSRAYP